MKKKFKKKRFLLLNKFYNTKNKTKGKLIISNKNKSSVKRKKYIKCFVIFIIITLLSKLN